MSHTFYAVFEHAWLSTHLTERTDKPETASILCGKTLGSRIVWRELTGTYAEILVGAKRLDEYPVFGKVCKVCLAKLEDLAKHWLTQKTCRCGEVLTIQYGDDGGGEHSIKVANGNGHFRSKDWPNWVYCNGCQRKHDLTKFVSVATKEG